MYNLEYLPAALRDMAEIAEYISKELKNPQSAVRLAEKFIEKAETLRTFPYGNQVYQPIRPLKYEYRKIIVDHYLMFYTVDEKSKTITIMRVIYARRNYEDIL